MQTIYSDYNGITFKKVHPSAKLPQRKTPGSVGYDLCSVEDITVPPRGRVLVDTGLQQAGVLRIGFSHPPYYIRIAPRSGLALHHGLDVGAGVIDSDYRGNIKVILFNHTDNSYCVKSGDPIAQAIFENVFYPQIYESENVSETQRGEGGFGSTDKK